MVLIARRPDPLHRLDSLDVLICSDRFGCLDGIDGLDGRDGCVPSSAKTLDFDAFGVCAC